MQNVLPITPGNPLRNVTGLARQISLPGEHQPLRFPSFPALERTAVIGFNQPTTVAIPANTTIEFTQFRQAVYPSWADIHREYLSVIDVNLSYAPGIIGTGGALELMPANNIRGWASSNRAANALYPSIVGSGSPFPYALLAADRGLPGHEWIYGTKNGTLLFMFTANTPFPASSFQAMLEVWGGPGEATDYTSFSFSSIAGNRGAAGTISLNRNGWFRIRMVSINNSANITANTLMGFSLAAANGGLTYVASNVDPGQINCTYANQRSHLPTVIASEFVNSQIPWYNTRVTASAFLGTNVSQVLNKGGTILGGRLSPGQYNAWLVDQSIISNLHPAEKAYLPLETGVYTYCPPSTDLVFFHEYVMNNYAGLNPTPLFVLSNDSMYNKMYITASAADESLACTVSWHLEFRTSSALFQIGLSGMTLEALHSAQLVLAENGFFFENPEHDDMLNKITSTAKKYVPQAVGIVNPAAGKMLQSVIAKMSSAKTVTPKVGPGKPATTTAKNSGILGPPARKEKKKNKKAKIGPLRKNGKY